MIDRERQEFLYDGTPEGAHRLLAFVWGYEVEQLKFDPGREPAGGVTKALEHTFRPGDIVQRENWGETVLDSNDIAYRILIKRPRLQ